MPKRNSRSSWRISCPSRVLYPDVRPSEILALATERNVTASEILNLPPSEILAMATKRNEAMATKRNEEQSVSSDSSSSGSSSSGDDDSEFGGGKVIHDEMDMQKEHEVCMTGTGKVFKSRKSRDGRVQKPTAPTAQGFVMVPYEVHQRECSQDIIIKQQAAAIKTLKASVRALTRKAFKKVVIDNKAAQAAEQRLNKAAEAAELAVKDQADYQLRMNKASEMVANIQTVELLAKEDAKAAAMQEKIKFMMHKCNERPFRL